MTIPEPNQIIDWVFSYGFAAIIVAVMLRWVWDTLRGSWT